MVKEKDITQERLREREELERTKGLVKEMLTGEDVLITIGNGNIRVRDSSNTHRILTVAPMHYIVTVFDKSYEDRAREIARAYEGIIKGQAGFHTDYSGIED